MNRFILSLIGTALSLSALAPIASAKDTIMLGNTLVAAGFCTVATDGTRGVKIDGVTSYKAWLDLNALNDPTAYRLDVVRINPTLSDLQIDTIVAQARKDESRFQSSRITLGQNAKCVTQ